MPVPSEQISEPCQCDVPGESKIHTLFHLFELFFHNHYPLQMLSPLPRRLARIFSTFRLLLKAQHTKHIQSENIHEQTQRRLEIDEFSTAKASCDRNTIELLWWQTIMENCDSPHSHSRWKRACVVIAGAHVIRIRAFEWKDPHIHAGKNRAARIWTHTHMLRRRSSQFQY